MTSPLSWISRDGKIIIAASGVRSFGVGYAVIVLGVYLGNLGLSLGQIGGFFTAGVAGSAFLTFAVGILDGKIRRRTLFIGVTLVQAAPVAALVLSSKFELLAAAAFFGAISGVAARGPVQPLEMASVASCSTPERRTDAFAFYRIVSTLALALGSLAAGLAPLLADVTGMSDIASQKALLVSYAVLLVASEGLYSLVTPGVEAEGPQAGKWVNPLRLKSRGMIFKLTGLFCIDHFAGTLIVQSLVAYWFNTRFGYELASLAWIFFVSNVLAAVSLWVAARIADRIGLINTMVFTPIPSSLFMIAAAFSPAGWLAVVFWQARSFFGQMDVPTRDSYTMAIVPADERVAMASIQWTGRSIAGVAGPSVAAALWTGFSAAAPFLACGILKLGYDVALFALFKSVKTPEEVAKRNASPPVV